MYTQVLYSPFLYLSWGFMPTYTILKGYVHKNDGDLEWKPHSKGFLTCIGVFLMILTHEGAFISYF